MNKKLLVLATSAVIVVIIVLWTLLRLPSIGQTHDVAASIIAAALVLIAFPMKLYVIFVLGENGQWSIPVLVFFILLSGLIWGVIIERTTSLVKKTVNVRAH